MSYSIGEGVSELREKLKSEIAIAEKYPDAALRTFCGEQLWVSDDVVPTDIDIFITHPERAGYLATMALNEAHRHQMVMLGYVKVKSMRVYQPIHAAHPLHLHSLPDESPAAYAALVELVKKR